MSSSNFDIYVSEKNTWLEMKNKTKHKCAEGCKYVENVFKNILQNIMNVHFLKHTANIYWYVSFTLQQH